MTRSRKPGLRAVALGLAIGAGFMAPPTPAVESPGVAVTGTSVPVRPIRPYWIELTLAQRQALTPLADDWERLDGQTKKKWIEIANRYPRMTPDEQGRTQQRMREWALLTPDQRRVARDSFARVRSLNPAQRADMLRKYQDLPPEKKQALVTEGRSNKVIVVPKPIEPPVPRRTQIVEGAKVGPALAAQKSVNPPPPPAPPVPKPVTPPVTDPSTAATASPAPFFGPAVSPAQQTTAVAPSTVPPSTVPPSTVAPSTVAPGPARTAP